MERLAFGKTGMQVSALGFGGAEIGFQAAAPETVERLLNIALDAGLNVIDTAECYGESESLIGNAVGHRRGEFFLFTKCGHAAGFDLPEWDPRLLEQSIDRSLERLRTDCLDLVQLHTCSEDLLRRGDVIAVLQRARAAGKTRFIGYSGDNEAARYAVECGAFDSLQTSISIADQDAIDRTVPAAHERGMGVIAKRPIANACWRAGRPPDSPYQQSYWDRIQAMGFPFLHADVEQGIAIALRFTLSVPGVSTAIVGTQNPDRWPRNAALLEAGLLSVAEFEAIRHRWHSVAAPDWRGQG